MLLPLGTPDDIVIYPDSSFSQTCKISYFLHKQICGIFFNHKSAYYLAIQNLRQSSKSDKIQQNIFKIIKIPSKYINNSPKIP